MLSTYYNVPTHSVWQLQRRESRAVAEVVSTETNPRNILLSLHLVYALLVQLNLSTSRLFVAISSTLRGAQSSVVPLTAFDTVLL